MPSLRALSASLLLLTISGVDAAMAAPNDATRASDDTRERSGEKQKKKKKTQKEELPFNAYADHKLLFTASGTLGLSFFQDSNIPPPPEANLTAEESDEDTTQEAVGPALEGALTIHAASLFGDDTPISPGVAIAKGRSWVKGKDHMQPGSTDASGQTSGPYLDSADYVLALSNAAFSMLFGIRTGDRSVMQFRVEVGYAWGTIETTQATLSDVTTVADVSGATFGVEWGFGRQLSDDAYLMVMLPLPQGRMLSTDNEDAFPFLAEPEAVVLVAPLALELSVGF